jgi:hypothetical protein
MHRWLHEHRQDSRLHHSRESNGRPERRAVCVCFVNWAKAHLTFRQYLTLGSNSMLRLRAGRALGVCKTKHQDALAAAFAKR